MSAMDGALNIALRFVLYAAAMLLAGLLFCGTAPASPLHIYIGQGQETDRSIEETLDIGWKLLSILPKSELKRIKLEFIEKYLPKEG